MPITQEQIKQLYEAAKGPCTDLADRIKFELEQKALQFEGAEDWRHNLPEVLDVLFKTDGDGSQERIVEYFGLSENKFTRDLQFELAWAHLIDHTTTVVAKDSAGNEREFLVVLDILFDENDAAHRHHDEYYRATGIAYWGVPSEAEPGYELDEVYRLA
jgi:hypothetical protein